MVYSNLDDFMSVMQDVRVENVRKLFHFKKKLFAFMFHKRDINEFIYEGKNYHNYRVKSVSCYDKYIIIYLCKVDYDNCGCSYISYCYRQFNV